MNSKRLFKIYFSLNEETRKHILERYVSRYINHVTSNSDSIAAAGGWAAGEWGGVWTNG